MHAKSYRAHGTKCYPYYRHTTDQTTIVGFHGCVAMIMMKKKTKMKKMMTK